MLPPTVTPDTSINPRRLLTPTRAGMLGGFEHISRVDIQGSKNFFAKLRLERAGSLRIADCGAGYHHPPHPTAQL